MTASNHVITGAVIALVIRQPELVLALAFVSHYVLDMIPHFGMYEGDVIRRNQSKWFRGVLTADILLMLALLVVLPYLASGNMAWPLVLAAMVTAVAPDAVWVYRFIHELKTRQWQPGNWSTRFHQAIQWFEHPIGMLLEILWLSGLLIIFSKLVS